MTILQDMNAEQIYAEMDRLRQENARLLKRATSRVSIKVSAKGALSVYGLGRFPVTLYASQWRKLLSMAEDIKQVMADNADELSEKD